MPQEVTVVHLVRGRPAVLEAAVRLDAVEQPRIVGGDLVLLDRAARAAGADRVADRAVRLDDVLLEHHQRLRRHDVVRVVAADVEVVVRDEEAARERHVDDVVLRRAVRVPRRRAAAELVEHLVVPARLRRPRRPRRGRIVEHRDVIEPAVHRAALEPDDVRHGRALVGGRVRDRRRRRRGRRVIRLERVAGRVHVHVRVRGGRIALRVGRCGETGDGLAQPRLNLRPREDRAAARMVRDREVHRRRLRHRRDDLVLADGEAGDEALEPAVRPDRERRRHVPAVEADAHGRGGDPVRHVDLHERVPAGDEVGAIRQRSRSPTRSGTSTGFGGRRTGKRDEDESRQHHCEEDRAP